MYERVMARVTPVVVRAGVAAVLSATLVACSGGASDDATSAQSTASNERSDKSGGTLTTLSLGPVLTWDPQRIASRDDAAFAGRIFARTLTAYKPDTDPAKQSVIVGDLATDTGTPSEDLKSWQFTLRDGVKWQDGSAITCEDVKYGVSRTFASSVITGGATDAIAVLNVPKDPRGAPTYKGPYVEDAAGKAAFDKAVVCKGSTITFALSGPTSDFNEMVTQPAFAPVKAAQDKREAGTYAVFSSGPYQLAEPWQASKGARWKRNPNWDSETDEVRKAYPDEIEYREGIEPQPVAQQIMADEDSMKSAVSLGSAPPALQQHIAKVDSLNRRSVAAATGFIDYLVPNTRSPVFATVEARQALAIAINREGYVTALGGEGAGDPAVSLLPASLPSAAAEDVLKSGNRGDPARAKALLAKAKVTTPAPIRVAYRTGPEADKAMAALVSGWTDAGFAPTLIPIESEYFTTINKPDAASKYDVFWSNWQPTWASASTILPALFDSTVNLTAVGSGRDYGYYSNTSQNQRMAQIMAVADRTEREKQWAALDAEIRSAGGYVPLAGRQALFIAGSQVRNLAVNEVLGGVVELADIAVK